MGKITLRHALGSAASLVEELAENQVYVKVIVYHPESKRMKLQPVTRNVKIMTVLRQVPQQNLLLPMTIGI